MLKWGLLQIGRLFLLLLILIVLMILRAGVV
jgi:hypothetical protein